MKIFLNNKFVNIEKASISINDLTLNRGYGVFDFLRTKQGIPLFVDDYLDRFFCSAKILKLTIPYSKTEIKNILYQLIKINNLDEVGIRFILTGGESINNFTPSQPNLIITPTEIKLPDKQLFNKGLKLITQQYIRTLPQAKTTQYLMAIWLQDELKKQHADDVIYTYNSKILELPRANIFIVNTKNELITPNKNVLHGITRKNILSISSSLMKVKEKNISIQELLSAKEVFISSTTKRVLPVYFINNKKINDTNGIDFTKEIYKSLVQQENQYIKEYN